MNVMNRRLRQYTGSLVEAVLLFMGIGGQTTGRMDARQACLYTGLQLEELAEKLTEIQKGCITPESRRHFDGIIEQMNAFSLEFKQGLHQGDILRADPEKLIDADFDCAWVSVGALASVSSAPLGAIAHGAFTNLDKFVESEHGTLMALKDENGKIQKRAFWQPPDFRPFIDSMPRN